MKSRILRSTLNNTGYTISNHKNYIAIGSPLCHDLIAVDKQTMKIKLALDPFNEGRKTLEGRANGELLFIYDRLVEMIGTGELNDIINGDDVIENPLPVFYVDDGKLIETVTDCYGWPNTTITGELMYDNTHFKSRKKAIEKGISELGYAIENMEERVIQCQNDLQKANDRLSKYKNDLAGLQSL